MSAVAPASFSLDVILWLQQWSPHPWLDSLMVGITLAGDPKIIFLFIAPLVCWLHAKNRLVGVDVLLGMVVSDWTNAMLKWPARGDRPVRREQRTGYAHSTHGKHTQLLLRSHDICPLAFGLFRVLAF